MYDVASADAESLAKGQDIPWEAYDDRTVVVTGATGLIGQALVRTLLARASCTSGTGNVIALVRDRGKARRLFGDHPSLRLVTWDAALPERHLERVSMADYVFHCASMTDSASFVERPVEVISTTMDSATAMLELARRTGARLCLLSTMETYGQVERDEPIAEDAGGFLDTMSVRNSYPEAKRAAEALCAAYASELGVDALVVRLAQTFGPGVTPDDARVFAYFARCVRAGEDIVLLTDGSKRNSYLYTADAVSALLVATARGEAGRAYNAANDETFRSVLEMAQLVAERFGGDGMQVQVRADGQAAQRFRAGGTLRLDTSALRALGWMPKVGLARMYESMLTSWQEA